MTQIFRCSSWFIEENYCNGIDSGQGGFLHGQLVCDYLIWIFSFDYIQSKTLLLYLKLKKKIENQGKPELIILFCQQRISRLQEKPSCQLLCYLSRFLSYFWI